MFKKVFLLLCIFLISGVVVANEKSVYEFSWLDKDKEIYVLQNRKFRKVGKQLIHFMEITVFGLLMVIIVFLYRFHPAIIPQLRSKTNLSNPSQPRALPLQVTRFYTILIVE